MSLLRTHFLLHSIFALGIAGLAYILGGILPAQSVLIVYLILWLIYHLRHIAHLHNRLQHPHKQPEIPYGSNTLWGELFDRLDLNRRRSLRHQNRLRQTLKRFQTAAQALPNGIMLINRDGRIEWLNYTAYDHLQLTPQAALGNPAKKQISLPQWQTFLEDDHDSAHVQLSLPQKNGIARQIRLVRIPFTHQSKIIISEDVSRAEQLNATRTAFIANVSHELRTPLTVINGFLETLSDYPALPAGQQQHFIALMQTESRRMLSLIEDLLTLSVLEDPAQQTADTEIIDLSQLCRTIVQAAQHLSGSQNHRISLHAPEHVYLHGNQRNLYQGLSNIVFNAVRYTPAGGHIAISLTLKDNPNPYKPALVRFAVRDNGVGIAAEHIPYLTERFYRVDKGRSRQSGGTGLGLAIAKHALANHGAVLHIQSAEGKGSEFSAVFQTVAAPTDKPSNIQAA